MRITIATDDPGHAPEGRKSLLGRDCRLVAVITVTALGLAGVPGVHAAQLPGRTSAAGAGARQGCHRVPQLTGLTLARA
ncbi:MAG TPA: hypothetical protein VGH56_10050, partial [Solirubrobacteraceae bacterium]